MKKIFILTLSLISFLIFTETNAKVNTKAEAKGIFRKKEKTSEKFEQGLDKGLVHKGNNQKSDEEIMPSGHNPSNDSIGYSKVITVHGMVCAFCANSLEKKLKKEEAIDQIKVELTNKTVSVLFKKGKSITDKTLKEIITSLGFKVVKIEPSINSG